MGSGTNFPKVLAEFKKKCSHLVSLFISLAQLHMTDTEEKLLSENIKLSDLRMELFFCMTRNKVDVK